MSARKLLAIDGGGIKGVFPAAFLAEIERTIAAPVVDYFDLIAGTSTGGIIAVGLGLGMPASELLKFYVTEGPKIFQASPLQQLRWLFGAKYDPAPLKDALDRAFKSRELGESQTRLLIPSLDIETGKVHIFKTAHHELYVTDFLLPATEVALASAAAPSYFPTHRLQTGAPLVDGGLWANNPTGIAAVEALGVLKWSRGDVSVLSLGCTEPAFSIDADRRRRLGIANYWARRLVETMMAGQSSGSVGTAKILLGKSRVIRVSPGVGKSRFSLDRASDIESLRGLGTSEARRAWSEVRTFFDHPAEKFIPERSRDFGV